MNAMNDLKITMNEHKTVLLNEAIEALVVDPSGLYVDGTFGRGGHCAELLSKLSEDAEVIAIDKDPQAVSAGLERFKKDKRLAMVHGSFADLAEIIEDRLASMSATT